MHSRAPYVFFTCWSRSHVSCGCRRCCSCCSCSCCRPRAALAPAPGAPLPAAAAARGPAALRHETQHQQHQQRQHQQQQQHHQHQHHHQHHEQQQHPHPRWRRARRVAPAPRRAPGPPDAAQTSRAPVDICLRMSSRDSIQHRQSHHHHQQHQHEQHQQQGSLLGMYLDGLRRRGAHGGDRLRARERAPPAVVEPQQLNTRRRGRGRWSWCERRCCRTGAQPKPRARGARTTAARAAARVLRSQLRRKRGGVGRARQRQRGRQWRGRRELLLRAPCAGWLTPRSRRGATRADEKARRRQRRALVSAARLHVVVSSWPF